MKKFLKLSLCFILFTSSINSTIKDSISSIINYGPHATWLGAAIYANYQYFSTEGKTKKQYKEITDPTVLDFIKKECAQITDKPIRFYIGCTKLAVIFESPALALPDDIILINEFYYELLEKILLKNENDRTANDIQTLNIFKFLFQHESGHIKNNDAKWRLIRINLATVIKMATFELIKNHFKNNYITIGSYFGLNTISSILEGFHNKYQETRADMGVTSNDAIKGGIDIMKSIINFKNQNKDNLMVQFGGNVSAILMHPSEESRLENLEKKMMDLDSNYIRNTNLQK